MHCLTCCVSTLARLPRFSLTLALVALSLGCAEELDTERIAIQRGTLGEEMYRIACQRIAREAYPNDVTGSESREVCRGEAGPEMAAPGRMRALAEQRSETVASLDLMVPAASESALGDLLIELLPLYDAPDELLPNTTRATAALLSRMAADDDAVEALGRMAARRGMRTTELQLGVLGPTLRYEGLPDLTRSGLDALGAGGVAEEPFEAVQRALALELATLEADDPAVESTLDVTRALLRTERDEFDGALGALYVLRDERGLPIPRDLAVNGFVDEDADGLADVNAEGRFVGADGAELELPAPFATVLEVGTDPTPRDDQGRALGEGDLPIFATARGDGTLLAALLRESRPFFEGDTPVAEDAALALAAQLGAPTTDTREYGALTYEYEGFDSETSPMLDLLQAGSVLLDRDETRDVLEFARLMVRDHEGDLASLIDSGLRADELGDSFPNARLRENNEFWDDLIGATEKIARTPGMMNGLLRTLSEPETERLGQIFAEMARFRDVPQLASSNGGRDTPVLRGQTWTDPLDVSAPDDGLNQSLLQRVLMIMHELNGAEFCNKQDAHMIIRTAGIRIDLMDNALLRTFGLQLEPFDRCELLRLPNTTEAYLMAVRGELDLGPQIESALPGFLTTLTDIADLFNINALTLDGILEDNSQIPGMTSTPTPEAMNRLVYAEWNEFLNEMLERPTTIDGIDVAVRDPGRVLLAAEREFDFCGDQLLREGQSCSGTVERITFNQAIMPLLDVFAQYDPPETRSGDWLFGEFAGSVHEHFPTAANTHFQENDPNGVGFAYADGAATYQPILAQILGTCAWVGTGANATCDPAASPQLLPRLSRILRVADGVDVGNGLDGIDALAAAAIDMIDATRHPSLTNRRGSRTTRTNRGSRTIAYSPVYLLLDAISAVDDAWAAAPEKHARWLRARSTLVDQMLAVALNGGEYELVNRRGYGVVSVVLDFLIERIDRHEADGDLTPWARGLTRRAETTFGGPLAAGLVRLLESMEGETEARDAIFGLVSHLSAEDQGFEAMLLAAADLVQILDDDENLLPLGRVLATAFVPDVRESLESGAPLTTDGSVTDLTITLLREVATRDPNDELTSVLARAATPRSETDPSTPLDTLLEVIAEVNRVTPRAGTPYRADDHRVLFDEVQDFVSDPERGLERLFSVVQTREEQ